MERAAEYQVDNVLQHIHFYVVPCLVVSVLTIVVPLTLYDHRTLTPSRRLFACNAAYQLGNSDAEPLNLVFQSLLVFPD